MSFDPETTRRTGDDDGDGGEDISSLMKKKEEEEDIRKLRKLLEGKPRNARAMATLSTLLAEQSRLKRLRLSDTSSSGSSITADGGGVEESIRLAEKSIDLAPSKPFGYTALSMVLPEHSARMKALERAIAACNNNDNHNDVGCAQQHDRWMVPRIVLMTRRLIEPRREEEVKNRIRGVGVGSASSQHPNRRPPSGEEESLYRQTADHLNTAWSKVSKKVESSASSSSSTAEFLSENQIEILAGRDCALGRFFRKMQPLDVYRPQCRRHYHRAYEHLPQSNPNKSIAKFWLATISSSTTSSSTDTNENTNDDMDCCNITRCPKEYVIGLYSTFAESFDTLLVEKLEYRTPAVLRKLMDDTVVVMMKSKKTKKFNRALDLGCGTGLSGAAFRDCVAGELHGIDLSPEMIAKAKGRSGCYDRLVVGDVVVSTTTTAPPLPTNNLVDELYDLIFACDVFVYLGDLAPIFGRVRNDLAPDGIFAFSTELLEEGDETNTQPYRLHASARFAHIASYIQRLTDEFGFQLLAKKVCPIRKNEGKDVIGLLVVLRKQE